MRYRKEKYGRNKSVHFWDIFLCYYVSVKKWQDRSPVFLVDGIGQQGQEGRAVAKDFADGFYHSRKWKRCRESYIRYRVSVDGGMCEECREQMGYIVHHKEHITERNINNPDVTMGFPNLEYVCKECHDKFDGHGVGKKNGLLVLFDGDGQPVGKLAELTPP